MDHYRMSQVAYFTFLLERGVWPGWYQEMPEFFRGAVEQWMLASYLIGIEQSRLACGLHS